MTHFTSLLRASLVVIITFIVCNFDVATSQYVNSANVFGRCTNFSIQAGTAVTFNGVQTQVMSGSVGVSPGTSITGTPVLGAGYTLEPNTSPAINCAADENTAYLFFKGVTCAHTLASTELSGLHLFSGVYCTATGLTLTNTPLYLDANGDSNAQFIIQTATTLITSVNTQIILANGALAKNVYWQVGTAATLGASSFFVGQIVAATSISVGVSVNVLGRLFAQAAVTFAGTDVVTLPSQC
jgi:hypothetical protein